MCSTLSCESGGGVLLEETSSEKLIFFPNVFEIDKKTTPGAPQFFWRR